MATPWCWKWKNWHDKLCNYFKSVFTYENNVFLRNSTLKRVATTVLFHPVHKRVRVRCAFTQIVRRRAALWTSGSSRKYAEFSNNIVFEYNRQFCFIPFFDRHEWLATHTVYPDTTSRLLETIIAGFFIYSTDEIPCENPRRRIKPAANANTYSPLIMPRRRFPDSIRTVRKKPSVINACTHQTFSERKTSPE